MTTKDEKEYYLDLLEEYKQKGKHLHSSEDIRRIFEDGIEILGGKVEERYSAYIDKRDANFDFTINGKLFHIEVEKSSTGIKGTRK
jgi:hypothetical protein